MHENCGRSRFIPGAGWPKVAPKKLGRSARKERLAPIGPPLAFRLKELHVAAIFFELRTRQIFDQFAAGGLEAANI